MPTTQCSQQGGHDSLVWLQYRRGIAIRFARSVKRGNSVTHSCPKANSATLDTIADRRYIVYHWVDTRTCTLPLQHQLEMYPWLTSCKWLDQVLYDPITQLLVSWAAISVEATWGWRNGPRRLCNNYYHRPVLLPLYSGSELTGIWGTDHYSSNVRTNVWCHSPCLAVVRTSDGTIFKNILQLKMPSVYSRHKACFLRINYVIQ